MVRRKIATTLAACGMVMLLFGLSALPAMGAEPAHVALQPSPRPEINPAHRSGQAVEFGHVTGTVIDLTTGAPAAGIAVIVGADTVKTDANGNYDHWLPVGTYAVVLALADGQGAPEQGPLTVVVQAEAATLQHLSFRSPAQAAAAPTAVPTVAPVVAAAAAAPAPQAVHETPPKRLPRTGTESYAAWLWLAFGAMLLLAGGAVGFGPFLGGRSPAQLLRAHAANTALLRSLLGSSGYSAPRRPAKHTAPQQDDFLAALLERERRS